MTYEDFWDNNPQNYFIYLDNYQDKIKQQDFLCWLQGSYNMKAFEQVMHNAFSKTTKNIYPQESIMIAEEKNNCSLKDKMLKMIARVNAKFEKGA